MEKYARRKVREEEKYARRKVREVEKYARRKVREVEKYANEKSTESLSGVKRRTGLENVPRGETGRREP